MKEGRLRLGLTQTQVASRTGIAVSQLSNIEKMKVPVRADVALRWCRFLVVAEAWLAEGRHETLDRLLRERGWGADVKAWEPYLFRYCVDLHSRPVASAFNPRTLFTKAWETFLHRTYDTLASPMALQVPVVPVASDPAFFFAEHLSAALARWAHMLQLYARDQGESDPLVLNLFNAEFYSFVQFAAEAIFVRCMGHPSDFLDHEVFNFLRTLTKDNTTAIGFLHGGDTTVFVEPSTVSDGPVTRAAKRSRR